MMRKLLLICVLCLFQFYIEGADPNDLALSSSAWNRWKTDNKKTYMSNTEETKRFQQYQKNVQFVNEHNSLFEQGQVSFEMSVYKFADLSTDEFFNKRTGLKFNASKLSKLNNNGGKLSKNLIPKLKKIAYPKKLNYVTLGYVTSVKDQGNCGSCWAFAVNSAIESQMLKAGLGTFDLSEQNLMDCDTEETSCNGGDPWRAMDWLVTNPIATETMYPYTEAIGTCETGAWNAYGLSSQHFIGYGTEAQLMQMVATYGPAVVGIHATNKFAYYKKGVFVDNTCSPNSLNHAVLVVGYTSTYWLVKNSWGGSWGESGYIRMKRNKKNMCGINTYMGVPVL